MLVKPSLNDTGVSNERKLLNYWNLQESLTNKNVNDVHKDVLEISASNKSEWEDPQKLSDKLDIVSHVLSDAEEIKMVIEMINITLLVLDRIYLSVI